MKIKGKKIEGHNIEVIAIPRQDGDIIFKAQAVMDWTVFDRSCPVPNPPMKLLKGNRKEYNFEDAGYKSQIAAHADKRIAWMVLESLKATEDLEWETINFADSRTWGNWSKELSDSGFSVYEIQRIQAGVFAANCLNEAKVEQARQNFLQGQETQDESTGQSIEQPST